MRAHHHAELLAVVHEQQPGRLDEFIGYADDPVLFAAVAISAHHNSTIVIPDRLLHLLEDDLSGKLSYELSDGPVGFAEEPA